MTKESEEYQIRDIGDSVSKFGRGRTKMEIQYTPEQKTAFAKNKKLGMVKIEISCHCGNVALTKLVDNFNFILEEENMEDNTEVIRIKMSRFINQIQKLIGAWTQEVSL